MLRPGWILSIDALIVEASNEQGRFRFAHDKLREALLDEVTAEEKQTLHAEYCCCH